MTTHLIDPPTSGVPVVTKCCGKDPSELSDTDMLTWGDRSDCGKSAPTVVDHREPACIAAWPGCHSFGYDPACCRFPKSCSAGSVHILPAGHEVKWIAREKYVECAGCGFQAVEQAEVDEHANHENRGK